MERPRLKLLGRDDAAPPPRRGLVLAVGAFCAVAALASVPWGARDARRPLDARAVAERALLDALDSSRDDPRVADALRRMRSWLGRRPLDASARASYAALLAELAKTDEEKAIAAFHARVAARTAPVSVPVIGMAARALIGAGEAGAALEAIRDMFSWAPRDAAGVLAAVEGLVGRGRAAAAVPDDPDAHLAWARALRVQGRDDEAWGLLRATVDRWPDHDRARAQAAEAALARGDAEALAQLLPETMALQRGPESAGLWALRARARATAGDREGARADALEAARLGVGSTGVLANAARALEGVDDLDGARRLWTRALYGLEVAGRPGAERIPVLTALARLEERAGRAGDALRVWTEILEIDSDHALARARVEALKSGSR